MIAIVSILVPPLCYIIIFFLVDEISSSLSKFKDHNTILLYTFSLLWIGSLGLISYSLQICTLK